MIGKAGRMGARAALALVLALAAGCAVVNNFRPVERGEFYRSGQMEPPVLQYTLRRYDIQTVINLRGSHPEEAWYRDELAACEAAGVAHRSLQWSKSRLPEPESLAQFVAWCKESPRPALVHCQGGTHRSGVASACYVLLSGGSVDEARRQLGLLFGDAYIGRLLDLYEGSPLPFEEWCLTEYPEAYAAAQP